MSEDRDLALAEAQEAVHVERFKEGGVDSFYAGVRHAEATIRRMREGNGPHFALAVQHANLRQQVAEAVALHTQRSDVGLADGAWCPADGEEHPCPTLRALGSFSEQSS